MGSVKIQFFTRYIFFASLAISNLNIPKFSFGSENIALVFSLFRYAYDGGKS